MTDIRKVGDLCRIYQNALTPNTLISGSDNAPPSINDELLDSRARAQARRQSRAWARRKNRL